MGVKVLNDTAAKLKSLAQMRGRSPAWPDQAVRSSVSLTSEEAVAQHVVDLTAANFGALLAAVDGKTVSTSSGAVVLHTAGAEVRRFRMSLIDRLLAFLVNPDVAYILLVIGMFGVVFEISSPGAIAPGVAGAIALLMAFTGFGSLPTNIGGIAFIVLAIILFIVDIKAPTHGLLTAGGVVAFILGSFLLFPPWRAPTPAAAPGLPVVPMVRVSIAAIAVLTALVVAFFVLVLGKGIRAQGRKVAFGAESIVGSVAMAVTDIAPSGLVQMAGEQWSARAPEGGVRSGEKVQVIGREGLFLIVRRIAH